MDRLITIGELADLKAVSVVTIRRWEKDGKIASVRTEGGHRRYKLADFVEVKIGRTIAYARVSRSASSPIVINLSIRYLCFNTLIIEIGRAHV